MEGYINDMEQKKNKPGRPASKERRVTRTVSLSKVVDDRFMQEYNETSKTLSAIVDEALREWFKMGKK